MADDQFDRNLVIGQLEHMMKKPPKNIESIQKVRAFKAWHLKTKKIMESKNTNMMDLQYLLNDAHRYYW